MIVSFWAVARENSVGCKLDITFLLFNQIEAVVLECGCESVDDVIGIRPMSRDPEQKTER